MELLCPLCQKKLTVDDQLAGQVLTCPSCQGTFQAPTLPEMPLAAAPPAPPAYAEGSLLHPVAPPMKVEEPPPVPKPAESVPAADLAPVSPPPAAAAESVRPAASRPLPPLADGYNHIYALNFNQRFLSWVAVVALFLIFVLSFFPWTVDIAERRPVLIPPMKDNAVAKDNADFAKEFQKAVTAAAKIEYESNSMWSITFLVYNIFYFFTLIVAVLAFLLDKKLIGLPAGVKKMRSWRSLVVAGWAIIGLFTLLFHWAATLNFTSPNRNTAIFSLVLFLQMLVVVAPLLEFWLQRRKRDDLPIPKIEFRW